MADESQKLGQYTLLEKIAQGGMAQIFKAKTTDVNGFERLVVIKRILPHISADPEYVEMLIDEAKIAVNFTHGNIAQIYDLGRIKNDYFIVMEYVDGKTFSQITKRLKHRNQLMPLDILLYCMVEVCRALSYIHNKKTTDGKSLGVVHRDMSPQNVILSYAGQIKIIDFGVAKAGSRESKTQSGVLKGKFAYMSPEQSRSDTIDHRSDIFSMGVLLWELLTGERLFKRKSNYETIQAIQKAKYDHPSTLRRGLPKDFDKIIKKALQKNPKHRYNDAADMAHDLEKLLFEINPEFKPVYAAEFIYKIFGPEDDEAVLPNQIFVQEKTPITNIMKERSAAGLSSSDDVDEPTIRDASGRFTSVTSMTPVVRIWHGRWYQNPFVWLIAFFVFLFISGTAYVVIVSKFTSGYVEFVDLDSHSTIFINGDEMIDPPDRIKLEADQTYEIVIRKPGFEEFQRTVQVEPSRVKRIKIKFTPLPPPDSHLIIKTKPSGATIYVNNVEWKDKSPTIIPEMKQGERYSIGLFLSKFKFYKTDIQVSSEEDVLVEHSFVPNTAHLIVVSNPSGAAVHLNGQVVGVTPYETGQIEPEQVYQIEVQTSGFVSKSESITLQPGEERNLNFELQPIGIQQEIPQSEPANSGDQP